MNHVLVVGPPGTHKLQIAALFGDVNPIVSSQVGLIVPAKVSTKYFDIDFKIFVDEYDTNVNDGTDTVQQWISDFLSEAMSELREALDGVIWCIPNDEVSAAVALELFSKVRDHLTENEEWGGFMLVVTSTRSDSIEDECINQGLEYVAFEETGKNEYMEKLGAERIREVLETHEWLAEIELEDEGYEPRKNEKLEEMAQPLIGDPDALSTILAKLQVARAELLTMGPEEREKRAQEVVESVIDYL